MKTRNPWQDLPFEPRSVLDHRCDDLLRRIAPVDVDLLDHDYGAYADKDRGYFESLLHEIAHVVVVRRGVRAALRRPLEDMLGDVVPKFPEVRTRRSDPILTGAEHSAALARANDHEITTIAVSVIAAEHAGQPLDPRTIADSAVDGANVRDLGNAEAVTALICAAMKRPAVQRWGRELGRFLGTTYVLATGPVRNNR